MLHQVGVSFDLFYDARKHKIKIVGDLIPILHWTSVFPRAMYEKIHVDAAKWLLPHNTLTPYPYVRFQHLHAVIMNVTLL